MEANRQPHKPDKETKTMRVSSTIFMIDTVGPIPSEEYRFIAPRVFLECKTDELYKTTGHFWLIDLDQEVRFMCSHIARMKAAGREIQLHICGSGYGIWAETFQQVSLDVVDPLDVEHHEVKFSSPKKMNKRLFRIPDAPWEDWYNKEHHPMPCHP